MTWGQSPFPVSVFNNAKLVLSIPQLSSNVPPLFRKSIIVRSPKPVASQEANSAGGQLIVGGIVSFTVIIWVQLIVFPHISAILYILSIVAGHVVPASTSLTKLKLAVSITQLSENSPPLFKNSIAVNIWGNSEISQTKLVSLGQLIIGGIVSFTIILWTQVPTLPQESAIEYVLVNISGHVFPSDTSSTRTNVVSSTPQLSMIVPPALINSPKSLNGG